MQPVIRSTCCWIETIRHAKPRRKQAFSIASARKSWRSRKRLGCGHRDGLASNEVLPFQTRSQKPPQGVTPMKSPICDMLGIEFPLLAFSHCRDVVAAVSCAGGFGVLGATAHSPETLERELKWIDDHADGKPYGVDVLIPENISTAGEKNVTWKSLEARISPQHRDFTRNLLKKYDIELATTSVADNQPQPFDAETAMDLLEVSFRHPIRLIANALGVPVAALVGAREHALRQVAAGVDILVVQGTEAGGHCGEVSTMVLVPEVIK